MAYELIDPPFALKFREMPKSQLRSYFSWYLEQIPVRMIALQQVVRDSVDATQWNADRTPASLAQLGAWFSEIIETIPANSDEQSCSENHIFPLRIDSVAELTPKTLSIAVDIGMYFSQVLMSELTSLRWTQILTNKSDIDYGQPVLVEFSSAPFNPSRMIITLAYGIHEATRSKGDLQKLFHNWAALAIL